MQGRREVQQKEVLTQVVGQHFQLWKVQFPTMLVQEQGQHGQCVSHVLEIQNTSIHSNNLPIFSSVTCNNNKARRKNINIRLITKMLNHRSDHMQTKTPEQGEKGEHQQINLNILVDTHSIIIKRHSYSSNGPLY